MVPLICFKLAEKAEDEKSVETSIAPPTVTHGTAYPPISNKIPPRNGPTIIPNPIQLCITDNAKTDFEGNAFIYIAIKAMREAQNPAPSRLLDIHASTKNDVELFTNVNKPNMTVVAPRMVLPQV